MVGFRGIPKRKHNTSHLESELELEELFGVAVGEIASGIPLSGSANVLVGFCGGLSVFHGCWWADGDVGAPTIAPMP